MKRVFLFSLILIFILGINGCSRDSVEKQVKAKTKPVVERFFDSMLANDYEGMRQDFSDEMKKALPANELEKADKKDLSNYGQLVSWEYSGWMREGGFDIVLVRTKHEKGDLVQYKFVFNKGPSKNKISGLWIKPLPKGLAKIETDGYLGLFGSIAEDHLKAVKDKNFSDGTKDFSEKMLKVLGPDMLQKDVESVGDLVSWKFDHIKRTGENIILYYRGKFSNGETLSYQIVFQDNANEKKIMGVWIRPIGAQ